MNCQQIFELIATRPLLTKQDLAVRFAVSVRTIERMNADRRIPKPCYIAGPRWTLEEIAKWERSHRHETQS